MKGACGEGRCPLRACEGSTACDLKCLISGGAHAHCGVLWGVETRGAPTLLRVVRDGCVSGLLSRTVCWGLFVTDVGALLCRGTIGNARCRHSVG